MKFDDSFLYSKGVYWLYEIWNKDNTNILAKGKYKTKDDLIKSIGSELTEDILEKAIEGCVYVGNDGLKRFVKFVNLP